MDIINLIHKHGTIIESKYEIDIAGKTVEAIASLKPMYDPKADRVKG